VEKLCRLRWRYLQDNLPLASRLENDGRGEPPRQVGRCQGGERQPSSMCPPTENDATWINLLAEVRFMRRYYVLTRVRPSRNDRALRLFRWFTKREDHLSPLHERHPPPVARISSTKRVRKAINLSNSYKSAASPPIIPKTYAWLIDIKTPL